MPQTKSFSREKRVPASIGQGVASPGRPCFAQSWIFRRNVSSPSGRATRTAARFTFSVPSPWYLRQWDISSIHETTPSLEDSVAFAITAQHFPLPGGAHRWECIQLSPPNLCPLGSWHFLPFHRRDLTFSSHGMLSARETRANAVEHRKPAIPCSVSLKTCWENRPQCRRRPRSLGLPSLQRKSGLLPGRQDRRRPAPHRCTTIPNMAPVFLLKFHSRASSVLCLWNCRRGFSRLKSVT